MKQLLTINCVSCRHVASVTSDRLDHGIGALAGVLVEHVRAEHPEWGETGAQAAREYVYAQAEGFGWIPHDPTREKTTERQRQRALHLDRARAELTDQGGRGLPPEQGGTSDVKTIADPASGLGGSAVVQAFIAERAEYITAIENAGNGPDYHRWQGHAEARRQLAERLGLAP